MNGKAILGLVVGLVVLLAAAGYFGLGGLKAPDLADVNQTTQEEMDQFDLEVEQTEEGEIIVGTENAVEEELEQKQANEIPVAKEGEIIVEQGNPVVATVDGKDITRVDVYRFIQTMPQNMQQMPAATVYPVAMDQVINTRIVQNKADNADIEDTEEFKGEMAIAKQQIARNLYLQREVDQKITDSKVKKAYDDFIKMQDDVQERRARHILLETEEKAIAVIKQIQAGGDFAAVAQELSTGPTAPRGGDLGYFAKGEMVPEFSDAAFSMNKDDFTETPIQTQFGWHVIKIEDIRMRAQPTQAQMEPSIRAELRREVLDELIQEWRKDAKIEQFDINGKPLKKGANATGLIIPDAAPAAN